MKKQSAKSKRNRSWPNVYSRMHRGGQVSDVVDLGLIDGKRQRPSFKTRTEADTFAEIKRTERTNEGSSALALPQATKLDAAKGSAILSPHSVSLTEAAEYYFKHVITCRNAPTIQEIVDRMVKEAEANERRDRTVGDLK